MIMDRIAHLTHLTHLSLVGPGNSHIISVAIHVCQMLHVWNIYQHLLHVYWFLKKVLVDIPY